MEENTQSTTLTVGGDLISIPMIDPKLRLPNQVTTPEWMIAIDDLLISTIKGYETYSELFGWHAESSRETKGNVSGDLVSNAAVKQSDVIIVIPMGIYMPTMDNMMQTGKVLELVSIVRLANIADLKIPVQTIEFANCQICKIQQRLETAVITIRPVKRTNTVYQYGQDGLKTGQTVSEFDYTKGE